MFLVYLDKDNNVISKSNEFQITFNNDRVLEKCIEEFSDEDPCIFHKSLANKLLSVELFKSIEKKKEISLEELKEMSVITPQDAIKVKID